MQVQQSLLLLVVGLASLAAVRAALHSSSGINQTAATGETQIAAFKPGRPEQAATMQPSSKQVVVTGMAGGGPLLAMVFQGPFSCFLSCSRPVGVQETFMAKAHCCY